MKSGRLVLAYLLTFFVAALAAITVKADTEVGLELVLAVDASSSIDDWEFELQLQGLATAFRDEDVYRAIESNGPNGIAVTIIQWGVGFEQITVSRWRNIRDKRTAFRFADYLDRLSREMVAPGTNMGDAIRFASGLFDGNGFQGLRRIIDVQGDGRSNSGSSPVLARDDVVAKGVVVNGLPILNGDAGLERYFSRNVVGGPGAFVVAANDISEYPKAIKRKLLQEITLPIAMRHDLRRLASIRPYFPPPGGGV